MRFNIIGKVLSTLVLMLVLPIILAMTKVSDWGETCSVIGDIWED